MAKNNYNSNSKEHKLYKIDNRTKSIDNTINMFSGVLSTGVYSLLLKEVLPDSIFHSTKDALYFASKTYNDIKDGVLGNQVKKSFNNLEEAIQLVSYATEMNQDASNTINKYKETRLEFTKNILELYNQNETTKKAMTKTKVSLEGALNNLGNIGNEIKPNWWQENIDKPIINVYESIFGNNKRSDEEKLNDALEKSSQFKEFYEKTKDFYQKNQDAQIALTDLSKALEKEINSINVNNTQLEQYFPDSIALLKQGYGTESVLLKTRENLNKITNKELSKEISNYSNFVDKYKTTIGKDVPLTETYNFFENAINPFTISVLGVCIAKGMISSVPGGKKVLKVTDGALSKPFKAVNHLLNNAYAKKIRKDMEKEKSKK